MADESGKKRIRIRGLIVPVAWDENGAVRSIALSAFDEQEYLISSQGKGGELLPFMRMEVEVEGLLSRTKNRETLLVEKYFVRR